MTVLGDAQRRNLDRAVQRAREVAEAAACEAVSRMAVDRDSRPDYLSAAENELRLELREKARLLGDSTERGAALPLLVADIAYEQWHRLLFARFLEVNGLLRHPDVPDVSLSMEDCAELAVEEGEPDAWSMAATYAEAILPGVFRSSDPAVRLRFSPERRAELDALVAELDRRTLEAEDALGWVYQFWQTAEKKRVNDSGRKIGGADLAPVTQLFTENYMVRFLLENSLGAWWAGRHPESPLLAEWEYLRYLDDGSPAAGRFDEWPSTATKVTVMDPCCGSGHFLVAAFGMLWRMRAEEEGLSPVEAQDAVLRENLFGLELDPRCTQIAAFNVILEAWKQGGFRKLPAPQIACSGAWVPPDAVDPDLFVENDRLRAQIHQMGQETSIPATEIGSLRLPTEDTGADLAPKKADGNRADALRRTHSSLGEISSIADTMMVAQRSADILSRMHTLIASNPPYLKKGSLAEGIRKYLERHRDIDSPNLATSFMLRTLEQAQAAALVMPQSALLLDAYAEFRSRVFAEATLRVVAPLGTRAFVGISGEVVNVALLVASWRVPSRLSQYTALDVSVAKRPGDKASSLRELPVKHVSQLSAARLPGARMVTSVSANHPPLSEYARSVKGTTTGDDPRFRHGFWERRHPQREWLVQSSSDGTRTYAGLHDIIDLPSLHRNPQPGTRLQATIPDQGTIVVNQARGLTAGLSVAALNDQNAGILVPRDPGDLEAIFHFCRSQEYRDAVRSIDREIKVTNSTLTKVPFDVEKWRKIADAANGLPARWSSDPTEWLFKGTIPNATEPLQVAVARLLGYRWPDQDPDDLDELADADGIVALPALTGELDAATRLRALLARAYGPGWSGHREHDLIQKACGKRIGLADWLRDEFFKQHTKLFHQRPFLWHIWDGRKDGFSAIVNYHRLDRRVLEKLTYTVLGGWIDRQRAAVADDVAGADLRLAAALDLRRRLELILVGEPPYDIYVRWKSLAEQPIGWEPDLDDGVRLNIRPFVTAETLRSKVNVNWKKDRGSNPDGSERHNDLHPTLAERRSARAAGTSG